MDEKVKKRPERYRKIIDQKKFVRGCYCITTPINEQNCLDIYSSREFWFQYYQEQDIQIVGLAANRYGAEQILCELVQDVYHTYGEVNAKSVKRFFAI